MGNPPIGIEWDRARIGIGSAVEGLGTQEGTRAEARRLGVVGQERVGTLMPPCPAFDARRR